MIQLSIKVLEVVEGSPLVRVTLQDVASEREVQIWIGWPEAAAIQTQLEGDVSPRPMTHDLMANMLVAVQAKVLQLLISEMKEETFFATLTISANSRLYEIDCRPSDGIALALRAGAPIFIADELMEQMEQTSEQELRATHAGTIVVEREDTTIH